MAQFSIGEVEKVSGVKAHVLRYWEEIEPSLAPQKDIGGRRSYTLRDVQMILRIKHLIHEQHLTISEARRRVIEEADMRPEDADKLHEINEMRGELLNMFHEMETCKNKNKLNSQTKR